VVLTLGVTLPAGILIGLKNPDDSWEERLLRNPQFQARIEQVRKNLRQGKGISIEELRKKHAFEEPV
jgi:hypothetical protein